MREKWGLGDRIQRGTETLGTEDACIVGTSDTEGDWEIGYKGRLGAGMWVDRGKRGLEREGMEGPGYKGLGTQEQYVVP